LPGQRVSIPWPGCFMKTMKHDVSEGFPTLANLHWDTGP